jgi:F5/8 type C domain
MTTCAGSASERWSQRARALGVAAAAALTVAAPWLMPIAMSAEGRNLVAARNGGQVIKYTSERGGPWRAEKIIDEHAAPSGWASADGSLPQELIVRLPTSARFNTLVFTLDSGAPEDEWAREVSVYTADPFPTMGGWKLVTSVSLARLSTDQTFTVEPTDGRFVRLLITAAQTSGAPRVSLGQFKLYLR